MRRRPWKAFLKSAQETSKQVLTLADFEREIDTLFSAVEKVDSRVSFDHAIRNEQSRVDSDGAIWFRVTLFISPKGGFDLRQIDNVVYVLPHPLRPSEVAVSDPLNGFAIQVENWSPFHVRAVIMFKDSEEQLSLMQSIPIMTQFAL